ncbi:MAG: PA14 domain-containing protein, partial [Anaerohalosphaeraceae bacterium]
DRMGKLDAFWASDRNIDAPPTLLIDGVPMNTGGTITAGATLTLSGSAGTIWYTTDGSDPREWTYWDAGEPDPGVDPFTRTLVAESAAKKVLVPTAEVVSATATGSILREYWTGITGSAVADLTSDPSYPDSPTGSDLLPTFEAPTDWADNYGSRVRGYLHPTTSGSYTFWIASDDASELGLSTDDNPANASLIASVPGWTSSRQWYNYPEQQSAAVSLTAGQKYYIEALHKEGQGGDNLAVAWDGPGISGPQVIDGAYLSPAMVWVVEGYDDSSWTSATGGVGYCPFHEDRHKSFRNNL